MGCVGALSTAEDFEEAVSGPMGMVSEGMALFAMQTKWMKFWILVLFCIVTAKTLVKSSGSLLLIVGLA
jgi:hypothetical protein